LAKLRWRVSDKTPHGSSRNTRTVHTDVRRCNTWNYAKARLCQLKQRNPLRDIPNGPTFFIVLRTSGYHPATEAELDSLSWNPRASRIIVSLWPSTRVPMRSRLRLVFAFCRRFFPVTHNSLRAHIITTRRNQQVTNSNGPKYSRNTNTQRVNTYNLPHPLF